jgi:hypothetical protein
MAKSACRSAALVAVTLALAACSPSATNGNSVAVQGSTPATVTNEPAPVVGNPAPGVRNMGIVPGRPARVFIFAGVDQSCANLPEPELTVTKAPAKGDVTFRPGQSTKLAATASGTCIGTKATGTGVYYTAREGTSGTDRFSVTARLASGETMTRDFDVTIAQ